MEAILKASNEPDYPAEITLVISDNPEAAGLETARTVKIDSFAFPRSDFTSKADHESAISNIIDSYDIDLVCLAGYMRILSAEFVTNYQGKLINIHPSLLPKFKGLDTHARAIEAGETEHGCTIHYVNAEMDGGKIIAQAKVPILPEDTPETLAARVLVEEHRLYPATIRNLSN